MTREEYCVKVEEAISQFPFEGSLISYERYGNGHINDTFVIHCKRNDDTPIRYILQRMNHDVFKNPEQLMKNIKGITEFLKKKIAADHGDIHRETMNIIPTKAGNSFYKDTIGSYWRVYEFIENATCFEMVKEPDDFYQSAIAFGNFQKLLADYPAESLYETIPDFHNTPLRLETFKKAVKDDILSRAEEVTEEIDFIMEREAFTHILMDACKEGELPLKVTHNDTKLNNIMIDDKTGKAICVIDLDTVMPGFSVNDFGDSIRFGASTGAEDEQDLSKVNFDLSLYELYTRGFLKGCKGSLTKTETDMLPTGAKMMTFECGIRFLTDYLSGDTYFKIHREKHNLDRARTQFKLVADMERNWETMNEIVNKYR